LLALLDLLGRELRQQAYHLDGQTSMVEDYLDIRPEQRERLAQRLREGRVFMGPWFTSGEGSSSHCIIAGRGKSLTEPERARRSNEGRCGERKTGREALSQ